MRRRKRAAACALKCQILCITTQLATSSALLHTVKMTLCLDGRLMMRGLESGDDLSIIRELGPGNHLISALPFYSLLNMPCIFASGSSSLSFIYCSFGAIEVLEISLPVTIVDRRKVSSSIKRRHSFEPFTPIVQDIIQLVVIHETP